MIYIMAGGVPGLMTAAGAQLTTLGGQAAGALAQAKVGMVFAVQTTTPVLSRAKAFFRTMF